MVTYGLFQLWKKRGESREVTVALFTGLFIALRTPLQRLWCSHSWKRPVLLRSDGVIQSVVFIFIWLFWKTLPRLASGYKHSFILGGLISFVCYLIVLNINTTRSVGFFTARDIDTFAVLLGVLALKEVHIRQSCFSNTLGRRRCNTILAFMLVRLVQGARTRLYGEPTF